MKQRHKILVGFLVVILVVGSYMGNSIASSIQDAKNQKSELEKKKEAMEDKIADLEKEKGDIVTYIEKLDKQLNELATEIEKLNTQIKEVDTELALTREELEVAKETVNNQYATMKKRIKYMYENGGQDYIEIIFKADNISSLLNRAEYIEKISEYDKNLLENFKEAKELVAKKETELETKLAKLQELNDEVTFEKETVTELVDNKTTELAKYQENIDQSEEAVEEYNASIEKQENLIEDLLEKERQRVEAERKRAEEERKKKEQEAANNSSNNSSNNGGNTSTDGYSEEKGDFRWPLQVSGTITSTFGYRNAPTEGASTYHKGIDIGVPTGTPIVAAGAGTVVTASYQAAAGNYIMISHGNGIYTVYMHCSKLSVSVGQNVAKGEVIGYVGSTGVSTGPHLHFGVSVNGTYVNPLNYVSR